MPRKPRQKSETGIYHTVLRSINQHILFEEDEDYQKFLFILSDCKAEYNIDILAYCLMDNHIHILLHTATDNLSFFFQSFESKFVHWYNTKYMRAGHLFQDRYYSNPVLTSEQYVATLNYIHQNPIKANLCRYCSEYNWSSFNAFLGAKNHILNISYSIQILGSKKALSDALSSNITLPQEIPLKNSFEDVKHFYTDEKAILIFKETTNLTNTSEVATLKKSERNHYIKILREKGLTVKQVSRLMDVSPSTVKRYSKMVP